MSVPNIAEFFKTTIIIQLKDGHKFEGKLKNINYKEESIQLIQIEDLGNASDKSYVVAHDKKIESRIFESGTINEIVLKDKLYMEPKKYLKEDFWDPISQEAEQKQRPKYEQKRRYNNYRGNNHKDRNEGYQNNRNNDRQDNNNPRNYKKKEYDKREDRNEAEYR